MNIQILHSWLSEYLKTNAKPEEIGKALALSGPSVEKVEKWGNDDWVYDIEVTTNRVDMMSVYGIAREAAAILPNFGFTAQLQPLNLSEKQLLGSKPPTANLLTIKTDKELTSRVMAIVLEVDKVKESPQWLRNRLEAAGMRALNNIIDITNYVMTEIGHPTHVFDYDRISTHALVFRLSKKGEKATTLDNKTYELPGDDAVIDNGKGEIIDLPGIMGTANSVVTSETKRFIFFIDNDNPVTIRKTSMSLGIRTVAVTLNEKRVDPELGTTAMLRGLQLYKELYNAKPISKLYDYRTKEPKTSIIKITSQFINNRLGVPVKPLTIKQTLETLGFKVGITNTSIQKGKGGSELLTITVPTSRSHDVQIPEDIVEEVARIYGYHNLPSLIPTGEFPLPSPQADQFYWERAVKEALKNWGYYENYTYSLVSKDLITKFGNHPKDFLKLKNPLSTDWEYLRQSVIPSLLQSLANNQDKTETLHFFELANIYLPKANDLPQEILTLTLATPGQQYLNVKGVIEALASQLGVTLTFVPTHKYHYLDETFQADILIGTEHIGAIGEISPIIQKEFSLKQPATVSEINFIALSKHATKNKVYIPIPKYPAVKEQLTFFNDAHVPASEVVKVANSINSLIQSVSIIDVFENKLSLEVNYLDKEKNLTDNEVAPLRRELVKTLEKTGLKLQGQVN